MQRIIRGINTYIPTNYKSRGNGFLEPQNLPKLKLIKKTTVRFHMASMVSLPDILRRFKTYPSQALLKNEEGRMLPNSFQEDHITLILKPTRQNTKMKNPGQYP